VKNTALFLRWSWRDLRAHWAKVLAIALVIAIGTGAYAGLSSNANWRRTSYDASYDLLAMYDVRVHLATGAYVGENTLADVVSSIEHASWIDAADERLVVPTQVRIDGTDGEILVRGELTGADFSDAGPRVNRYYTFAGRLLDDADSGAPVAMLDRLFAQFHELPDTGTIRLSGGTTLDYVGQATTPEYFAVAPEGEIFLSEASFAGVFTTKETAQAAAGVGSSVNELVLTLDQAADRDVVVAEIEAALAANGVGAEVTTRDENTAYRTLTNDVDNDQKMFNALAFLLFAGAVVAAYIMIHRFAQQQRREFGIAMALGVPGRRIALRPMLVSAQIALLGVAFGVVVGILIGNLMRGLLESFVPLPIWNTSFQTGLFATVAAIGFLIPFLATIIPIRQAVRVRPIEAIQPLYHKAVPTGRRSRKVHPRGSTFTRMPVHNLRRSPWRSAFTTLSVALAVTVLVSFLGLVDSIFGVVDVAEDEAIGDAPDRMVVSLTSFSPSDGGVIAAIGEAGSVAQVEPTLRLGGTVTAGSGEDFAILLEFIDLENGLWRPTITAGTVDAALGVVIAEEAAADLGVGVGDRVILRHPKLTAAGTLTFVETSLNVMATHPYPIRNFAYIDVAHTDLVGLTGVANLAQVLPEPGAAEIDVQRELFSIPGVASVQDVSSVTENIRTQLQEFTSVIQGFAFPVIVLAMLIAFLTASINLDARSREHATMFAFGVKVRTALAMAIAESSIIGVTATVFGVLGGLGALQWMNRALFSSTMPDVGIAVRLEATTIATVVVLGIVAVAVAPLFTARRMRRMDLPGTLRLVE
jgi:putative ABC transport system permease protein